MWSFTQQTAALFWGISGQRG
uniref:Uncharacterized protein n=1 Tax=Anguilla anguilla TaxID=7936 RepID=A0A0E9V033_ANGAN